MWTQVGESTTETIIGTDSRGDMSGFLTDGFNRTGSIGILIDIGIDKKRGALRTIDLDRYDRDRS